MKNLSGRRPSPAMVVALVALFLSLGGVSYGVATGAIDSRELKNNNVRSADLRNNDVRTKDLRNNDVRGTDIRNSTIGGRDVAANTLTGADVNEGSLGAVPNANTAGRAGSAGSVDALRSSGGYKKATSSASNADDAIARAAATEVPLFSSGAFDVYGKCFVDTNAGGGGTPRVSAEVFARTKENGSVMYSDEGTFVGTPFLDTTTAELLRRMDSAAAEVNAAGNNDNDDDAFDLLAPSGSGMSGRVAVFAKQGALPGGDGIYGAGDVCLFRAFGVS